MAGTKNHDPTVESKKQCPLAAGATPSTSKEPLINMTAYYL